MNNISQTTLSNAFSWMKMLEFRFKRIFLNENVRISIKISMKFVPKGPINNNPEYFQIMGWRRSGDNSLSEPMMVSLLTHICVTRPQWVNSLAHGKCDGNCKNVIFKPIIHSSSSDPRWERILWNCSDVNATQPHIEVNIGSSNSLVASDYKPLPLRLFS